MVESLIQSLQDNIEVRATLIKVRDLIKDADELAAFKKAFRDSAFKETFYGFLKNDDAKVRRAAAKILSTVGDEEALEPIFNAYLEEETLYVREDLLIAISSFKYGKYKDKLKNKLDSLINGVYKEDEEVHISSEIRMLYEMLLEKNAIKGHEFNKLPGTTEIMLTTKRGLEEYTLQAVHGMPKKKIHGGVMVKTSDYEAIYKIRTFEEALIYVGETEGEAILPRDMAAFITDSGVVKFLNSALYGGDTYFYRLDADAKVTGEDRSGYIKALTKEIQKRTENKLINVPSNYEIELRLRASAQDKVKLYLKLCLVHDNRFNYRKEAISQSIKPYMAATIVEMAKPYLKKDVRIIDPFCGVGTMLLERRLAVSAESAYGVDFFGEAIDKARTNSELIGPDIHYVQRNFADFTHEHKFDEIITDMPIKSDKIGIDEIRNIYGILFKKGLELLRSGAVMIVYGNEHNEIKKNLRIYQNEYGLERDFVIDERTDSHLYIIFRK